MTTGERIRAARKAVGLTQEELARKLKIPYQSIGQWERNVRNPKLETLKRIASALNIPVSDLLNQDYGIESLRSGAVSPSEIAEEMNWPVERVWDVMQQPESNPDAWKKILEVGALLSSELDEEYRESMRTISYSLVKLNESGVAKAIERIQELTEIPKYQRKTERE